jgi:hypothetical protein
MCQPLRLSLFVILFIVGYPAAILAWEPSDKIYFNISCDDAVACASTMCECFGVTDATGKCEPPEVVENCTLAGLCVKSYIQCMNSITVAEGFNTSACKDALDGLKSAMSVVASGVELYNESAAGESCRDFAYMRLNETTDLTCTENIPYKVICKTPFVYLGDFRLSGEWGWALDDPVKRSGLTTALETDLTNFLMFDSHVLQLSSGSLVVNYEAEVAEGNHIFQQQISIIKTNTEWLIETKKFMLSNDISTDFTFESEETSTTTITEEPVTSTPSPAGSSLGWTVAQLLLAIAAVVLIA